MDNPPKYFCPNCRNPRAIIEIPVEVQGKLTIDLYTQKQIQLLVVKENSVVISPFANVHCLNCGHSDEMDSFIVGFDHRYSVEDIVFDLRDHKAKKITCIKEGTVSFDNPPTEFSSIDNIRPANHSEKKEYRYA
jgi:predicted nucleic-acid-binding Zn-ribbon protein